MLGSVATALLVAASAAVAAPIESRTACYSGLYVIVARGSTEPQGEGVLQTYADQIVAQVPDSASVAVVYPATIFASGGYPTSVTDGINAAKQLVMDYVDTCGYNSQIALLGYSQGGNVLTDMLAGGIDKPAILDSYYTQFINAIAVFGDPTNTAGQSFDSGTATSGGIFARGGNSLAILNTYADRLVSYCDNNDPVCARGFDINVHYAEVPNHGAEAVQFVVDRAYY